MWTTVCALPPSARELMHVVLSRLPTRAAPRCIGDRAGRGGCTARRAHAASRTPICVMCCLCVANPPCRANPRHDARIILQERMRKETRRNMYSVTKRLPQNVGTR